ncbi:MAG: protein kinase [Clostridiales bacterium]|nr:protein kinase [Clostridiales bacterium]
MQIEKICINCMKEKTQQNGPCPHCGFDNNNYQYKSNHLRPMTVLNGKYLLGRSIGQGGFGIVYIALDLSLNIVVAIKELFPENMMTRIDDGYTQRLSVSYAVGYDYVEEVKRKFIQEARTIAKVEGSTDGGVVQVKDLFEENGTAYMVMEYLEGQTMKSYLKEYGKLDFETVADMMKPVMESLKKLHDAGIVHRDISPDNIMLLKSNRVKLLDFGDVKFTEAAAREGENAIKSEMIQVKKGYTPLEQYQLEGYIGPWTDIYALCSTIYQCITGIQLAEPLELKKTGIKKPSQMGIKIPAKAENALMKGLRIDYEERIQDIQQLYNAFYSTVKREPNPGRGTKLLPWCGIVVLVAIIVTGIVLFTHGSTKIDEIFVKGLEGYFTISSTDNTLYWEITEDYLNGAQLQLVEQKDIKNQCFEFVNANEETYYLLNVDTGLALTLDTDYLSGDQVIVQRELTETVSQQWYVKQGEAENSYYLGVSAEKAEDILYLQKNDSGELTFANASDTVDQEKYQWKVETLSEEEVANRTGEYEYGDIVDIPDGLYVFSAESGVMSLSGNYTNDGYGVVLSADEDHNYQKFYVYLNDSGYRTIYALHSNSLISEPDRDATEGIQLVQWSDTGVGNQNWEFIYYGFGKIMIRDPNGMCIGRNEETGEIVLCVFDEANEENIVWEITQTVKNEEEASAVYYTVPVGTVMEILDATYMIQLEQDESVLLGVRGGYSDNGMDVGLTDYEKKNSNKFYIILGENGYYELAASHTNMYLAPDEDGVLRQYSNQTENETERYQWLLLYGDEDGVYILQNVNGKCISCVSGESGEQAVLMEYDPGNNLQYWKLVYTTKDSEEDAPLTEEQATKSIGEVMEITAATYMIQLQARDDILLGIRDGYSDNQMDVNLLNYEEKNSNKFYLLLGENGYYALVASHTNMYLASDEQGILRQYENATDEEYTEGRYQWSFLYGGDKGVYIIQNKNGQCIGSVTGESGEQAVLMDYDPENELQYWKLIYTTKNTEEDAPLTEEQATTSIGDAMEITPATYMIQLQENTEILLGVRGGYSDNEMDVDLLAYEEKNSNKFYVLLGENGMYALVASHSNRYLAPDEEGGLRQYTASTDEEQAEFYQWKFLYGGDKGIYIIQNKNGQCIGCVSGEDGEQAVLMDYDPGNLLQYWKLVYTTKDSTEDDPLTEAQSTALIGSVYYVEAGTYMIQSNLEETIVLGIESGSLEDGALVIETDYEEVNNNRFYLVLNEEGFYSIRASQTNMYIAPDEDGILHQFAGSETEGFEWTLLYAGANTYFIQHESGKCIGNTDGLLQNGESIQLQNFNTENTSLYWKLIWSTKD